jgi:hypothetical protein
VILIQSTKKKVEGVVLLRQAPSLLTILFSFQPIPVDVILFKCLFIVNNIIATKQKNNPNIKDVQSLVAPYKARQLLN